MAGLLLALGSVVDGDDSSRAGRTPELVELSSAPAVPHVELDTVRFVRRIDNPWWPMLNGTSWRFRRSAGGETTRIDVAVTNRRRIVRGIEATVVRSGFSVDGELVEDMRDWYVQDSVGNVWHLGRDARQYDNGAVVGTTGSWEAGVDGAQAGIAVPANPRLGAAYGRGRIVSFDQPVEVPGGVFARTLVTEAKTPFEPQVREHMIFARGVGPVLTIDVGKNGGRVELIRFRTGSKGS